MMYLILLVVQVGQFPTLLAAVQGIAAEGGAAAFYSGLGISIAREIPFALVQFPVYEALKRVWVSGSGGEELSPLQGAVCGSIAGSAAAAATTPLDLLKTRQMIGGAQVGLRCELRRIMACLWILRPRHFGPAVRAWGVVGKLAFRCGSDHC